MTTKKLTDRQLARLSTIQLAWPVDTADDTVAVLESVGVRVKYRADKTYKQRAAMCGSLLFSPYSKHMIGVKGKVAGKEWIPDTSSFLVWWFNGELQDELFNGR